MSKTSASKHRIKESEEGWAWTDEDIGWAYIRYRCDDSNAPRHKVPANFIQNYRKGDSFDPKYQYKIYWSNDKSLDTPLKYLMTAPEVPVFETNQADERFGSPGCYRATVYTIQGTLQELNQWIESSRAKDIPERFLYMSFDGSSSKLKNEVKIKTELDSDDELPMKKSKKLDAKKCGTLDNLLSIRDELLSEDAITTVSSDSDSDENEPDLNMKEKESDVKVKVKESDVKVKGKESDVKMKGKESDVKMKGKESDVKMKGKESDVKVKGKELDVKLKRKELDVKLKRKEPDVKVKGKEPDVKEEKELDVKLKRKEPDVKLKRKEPDVKEREKEPDVKEKGKESDVKSSTQPVRKAKSSSARVVYSEDGSDNEDDDLTITSPRKVRHMEAELALQRQELRKAALEKQRLRDQMKELHRRLDSPKPGTCEAQGTNPSNYDVQDTKPSNYDAQDTKPSDCDAQDTKPSNSDAQQPDHEFTQDEIQEAVDEFYGIRPKKVVKEAAASTSRGEGEKTVSKRQKMIEEKSQKRTKITTLFPIPSSFDYKEEEFKISDSFILSKEQMAGLWAIGNGKDRDSAFVKTAALNLFGSKTLLEVGVVRGIRRKGEERAGLDPLALEGIRVLLILRVRREGLEVKWDTPRTTQAAVNAYISEKIKTLKVSQAVKLSKAQQQK